MRTLKSYWWLPFSCLILMSYLVLSQDDWQFKPGVIMASGHEGGVFKDVSGKLLTVNGYRRESRAKLEAVSIYHAIIFYPKAPIIGEGSGSTNSGPLSTNEITWTLQKNPPDDYVDTEEKRLEIRYHALHKGIRIGSETFSLSEGNLFIVRLNENWLPAVVQLKAHFCEPAEKEKVLEFFKSALREDEVIQKLEFY